MNKLGIIIQARTGSTRLPSKMILPFYGNDGILSILLSRLTQCKLADSIIVATTSSSPDDAICDLVREHRVKCFRGDENDVLDRFIQAARYYGISKIIRICADNPFLDIESLDSLILASENIDADYVSFCTSNHTPTIKTHFGFWAEYVTLAALELVARKTAEKVYHEHVTNYFNKSVDKYINLTNRLLRRFYRGFSNDLENVRNSLLCVIILSNNPCQKQR